MPWRTPYSRRYVAHGDLPRRVFLTGDLEREAHKAVARLLVRVAGQVPLEAPGRLVEVLLLYTLRHLFDPDTDRTNELQGRYLKFSRGRKRRTERERNSVIASRVDFTRAYGLPPARPPGSGRQRARKPTPCTETAAVNAVAKEFNMSPPAVWLIWNNYKKELRDYEE